ncbi:MAG: hypothetical protein ABW133_20060, partial [Polyangiaceae bacterium]
MTLTRRAYAVAVSAFLFTLLPGCKQILNLHDRTEGALNGDGGDAGFVIKPTAGQCGGILHAAPACAACMDAKCCDEGVKCQGDPACDPAYDCNTACGDDGVCRARCNMFFTRPDTFVDLAACRENNCKAECGLSCGGFSYAAPGCDNCVKQTCCPIATACAKNADCTKLDLCRYNCIAGSATCPPECEKTFSSGVDDLAPWVDCVSNQCGESCQTGHNWQCLDAIVPWIKPKSAGDITFSVTIVDIVSEQPFNNATVKACRKLDRDCITPIDVKTTGPDGLVALTVPAGSVGFDGYVDITGGDNGTGGQSGKIVPAIWYPTPFIISPGWRGRIQFVSYGTLDLLAGLTGATIDPTRGHFAANAQDCSFASAG